MMRAVSFALSLAAAAVAQAPLPFEVDRLMPGRRAEFGFVYDTARAEALVLGGVADATDRSLWAWSGGPWREIVPAGPSPLPCTATAATSNPVTGDSFLFGGLVDVTFQSTLWRWNGTAWTALGGAGPPPRAMSALACDPATGHVYLFGGADTNNNAIGDFWRWNGAAWQLIPSGPIRPTSRYRHAMTWDPSLGTAGGLILHGGYSYGTGTVGDSWTWTAAGGWLLHAGPTPLPNQGHSMCHDPARARVVLLAYDAGGASQTWEWNGSSWQRRFPSTVFESRQFGRLCYDATQQRVLLYGGGDPFGPVSWYSIWAWDGIDWTEQLVEPRGRTSSTAVFDQARARTVLAMGSYTGSASSVSLETWEYVGGAMQQVAVVNPPARFDHVGWYDSVRQRTLLHGGGNLNGYLGDTWEFDGATWVQRSAIGPTPGRVGATVAYDPVRDRAVLFGGTQGAAMQDTWEWNGSAWSQRFPAARPPARVNACMGFDPISQRVILFGGAADPGQIALADTWAWNGVNWQQLTTTTVPPASFRAQLVVDTDRQRLVLVDGPATSGYSDVHLFDWNGNDWVARGNVAAWFAGSATYVGERGRLLLSFPDGFRTELALPVDDLGPGDAVDDLRLSVAGYPAVGSTLQFTATTPVGGPMAGVFSLAPAQLPVVLPGPFCLPSNGYITQLSFMLPTTGTLPVSIPNLPSSPFLPFTVQFIELRGGCIAVSNALHLRAQP